MELLLNSNEKSNKFEVESNVSINDQNTNENLKVQTIQSDYSINERNETKSNHTEVSFVEKEVISNFQSEKDIVHNNLSEQKESNVMVVPEKSLNESVFPNIFTPNGDGNNDFFEINWSEKIVEFSISILDNQNKLVFMSDIPDFKWDGYSLENKKLPLGKYIYFITAKDEKGKWYSKSSYLTILY